LNYLAGRAASAGKARSPSLSLANMPQRNVGAIVSEKCQSVKLIKLIILIEIDYQSKMGIKGYLYSL
jgi:hypothetical protein